MEHRNQLTVKDRVCLLVASAGGLGLAPIAPGSFGTLAGVGIHLVIVWTTPVTWQPTLLLAALVAVCALHFLLTPWSVAYWRDSDPGNFVLDEVAGYLVVPLLVRGAPLWLLALVGFFLFRVFDIVKIPPARQIDRNMQGAWAILLDDIVSGMYAAGATYLLLRFTA